MIRLRDAEAAPASSAKVRVNIIIKQIANTNRASHLFGGKLYFFLVLLLSFKGAPELLSSGRFVLN